MLGTFPKYCSQAPQLTKGIFPSGNFPNVVIPKWQLPKSVLDAALVPPKKNCSLTKPLGSSR